MDVISGLALLGVIGGLTWMSWRDSRDYTAFKQFECSADRVRFHRRWTLVPLAVFGVGGLAVILSLGRLDALGSLPVEFALLIAPLEAVSEPESSSLETLVGMAIGLLLGLTITAVVWRRRSKRMSQPVVGDIEALLPRNGKEVLSCVPLALNAGISEEIFYRVALPLLVLEATGSVGASLLISIAAFGLAHWYQGWKGVLATSAMGALFFWLYLSSGSIIKPIAMHVLIDIIGLVVWPLVSQSLARRRSASEPGERAISPKPAAVATAIEAKANS
ncbi:CPBP family intramembrane glutamic endopeptidase [Croceicoccus sp. YJ47]|uniref:CPBP family intramembrane glutamic endopeptidase n=1 Tax=Croceicoccus sp. YJ47 TaxID=2798724 RepID=UPI0019251039|nr:CPBP family intramembrane glutamic endopeptidase [Croceicoccus sp. YJ47]QQN74384.1 CPBP family intramembrane metalloprotease [Croceicoccus sp. YJ47]